MTLYIKVSNGAVVGQPFTLPTDYRHDNGDLTANVGLLSAAELRALGLYPVSETPGEAWETVASYTVGSESVALTWAAMPLADYKNARLFEAYARCKTEIDAASAWYSVAEIAEFPALQDEIIAYQANSAVVGPIMAAIIARGRHTAASLAATLLPKMTTQAEWLAWRDAHVAAILALTTHEAVAAYVID